MGEDVGEDLGSRPQPKTQNVVTLNDVAKLEDSVPKDVIRNKK